MNVKRVLDLIVDGNIVSISHKGNKNIIFQGIKGADSFEEYNNFEAHELNSRVVKTDMGEYVHEMNIQLVD